MHKKSKSSGNDTCCRWSNTNGTATSKLYAFLLALAAIAPSIVTGLAIDKSPSRQQHLVPLTSIDLVPPATRLSKSVDDLSGSSSTQELLSTTDPRRPIWNMAHMVNSIKELDYRLSKGANAIEADVAFDATGSPLYTYHGPPCDCWRHCHQRELLTDYLQYIRDAATDDKPLGSTASNLTLLLLDLKLDYLDPRAKIVAGRELAKMIVENLFYTQTEVTNETSTTLPPLANHRLRLVVSINHISDVDLVLNFLHYLDTSETSSALLPRIGFDVGMNDELALIETMWRRIHSQQPLNIWQGDGWTNCISPFYNLERLTKALGKRDAIGPAGYMQKVYQWTIDLHDRLRDALRLGVDAIMTNHPERLAAVLQESEISQLVRLASRDDDPFHRFQPSTLSHSSGLETGRGHKLHTSIAKQINGGFLNGVIDILNSWLAYIKEIPYFSLPTTSRFLARRTNNQLKQRKATIPNTKSDDYPTYDTTTTNATAKTYTIAAGRDSNAASKRTGDQDVSSNKSLSTTPVTKEDRDDNDAGTNEKKDNSQRAFQDGPKWYTSLLTSVLIAFMRVMLPPQNIH